MTAGDPLGSHSGAWNFSSLLHLSRLQNNHSSYGSNWNPASEVTVCNNLLGAKILALNTSVLEITRTCPCQGQDSTGCMGQQLPDTAAGKVSCPEAQHRAGPEGPVRPWLIQDSTAPCSC